MDDTCELTHTHEANTFIQAGDMCAVGQRKITKDDVIFIALLLYWVSLHVDVFDIQLNLRS